jgi:orotate phosphoribosyltransferase
MTPTGSDLALAKRVYDTAHLSGEFVLRSGKVSDEYFDKYLFEAQPALLRDVAQALVPALPANVDALAGLELGGIPIATMLSQLTGLPTLFVRKQAKEYGTCRLAEGGEVAGQRLVIVEDVVSTGGAILDAARELRDLGADIRDVLCVIDRETGGSANLAHADLELHAAFSMSQLINATDRLNDQS